MQHDYKDDLIIGETSQVSKYLPITINRISARNISPEVFERNWNRVYVCFAEQRTLYSTVASFKDEFYRVNVRLTLDIIKKIKAKEFVYFSTVELWGKHNCAIEIDTPFDFEENYYTMSKHETTKKLKETQNVIILYPFNFNSRYRSVDFLMGKIFHSIMNKQKIHVGNLNWNRDILHASWVANQALNANNSKIIGSGTYFNVRKYVKDIYARFNMNFEKYVDELQIQIQQKNLVYLNSDKILYTYEQLLNDTVLDLHL